MVRKRLAARLSLVLAAVLTVEMQLETALLPVDTATRALVHVLVAVLGLAFALRSRFPLASLLAAQLVFVVAQVDRAIPEHLYVPLFLILFLNLSAAMHVGGRRFWLVPAVTLLGGSISILTDDYPGAVTGDLVWLIVIYTGLTTAIGRLLGNRVALQSALRAKADRVEAGRREARERAILDERERIAGDLRDIIAHALSAMVVQASVARRLAATDPDQAREAFAAVESSGREALGELRRLLGVLRREDEELALAPQPSLAHVDDLVARARAAGLPVDLRVVGREVPLPAGVDLTAYRVLQDALTQALGAAHAGRAAVTVRYDGQGIELEVRDDGHGRADGADRRMLGMRERVGLVGGRLQAGGRIDGGHRVWARLPLETR